MYKKSKNILTYSEVFINDIFNSIQQFTNNNSNIIIIKTPFFALNIKDIKILYAIINGLGIYFQFFYYKIMKPKKPSV
jgi:hypothetical protein